MIGSNSSDYQITEKSILPFPYSAWVRKRMCEEMAFSSRRNHPETNLEFRAIWVDYIKDFRN